MNELFDFFMKIFDNDIEKVKEHINILLDCEFDIFNGYVHDFTSDKSYKFYSYSHLKELRAFIIQQQLQEIMKNIKIDSEDLNNLNKSKYIGINFN